MFLYSPVLYVNVSIQYSAYGQEVIEGECWGVYCYGTVIVVNIRLTSRPCLAHTPLYKLPPPEAVSTLRTLHVHYTYISPGMEYCPDDPSPMWYTGPYVTKVGSISNR